MCEHVYVGDLNTFDVDQLPHDYEVLLFGDTLEHLPDPAAVLRRLRTRLAPGGHLVLSIPNVANWAMRLGLLAGHFDYTDRGILDRTHLRFYTRRTLIQMLARGRLRGHPAGGHRPGPGAAPEARPAWPTGWATAGRRCSPTPSWSRLEWQIAHSLEHRVRRGHRARP